jgi:UDP-4-amino-4-deoxy-L-arabinose-oxoglutarate aminotransferase
MPVDKRVEFYRHNLGQEEMQAVRAALGSLVLTTGDAVAEAERALSEYLGVAHVVCLDSCTAALHLALVASGIGPGDEVIVPAMTFIATPNAVVMAGATPVFADVDPHNGCLTAGTVEKHVNGKTRAIIPVHLYGLLCDMKSLSSFAEQHGLILIEDSAHCLEAARGDVRPGSHSHGACFSFYATKAITCGEGGALATNDVWLADRVRRFSLHGMTTSAAQRFGKRYQHWDMESFGWKCNLDNIRASLLTPQIRKLYSHCRRRRDIAARYEQAFSSLPDVEFPEVVDESWSARHLFTIWVDPDRRDDILAGLEKRGIGVAVNYRAVHLRRYYAKRFGYRRGDLPAAEAIGDRTISIPLYPRLTEDEVQRVIEAVTSVTTSRAPAHV